MLTFPIWVILCFFIFIVLIEETPTLRHDSPLAPHMYIFHFSSHIRGPSDTVVPEMLPFNTISHLKADWYILMDYILHITVETYKSLKH